MQIGEFERARLRHVTRVPPNPALLLPQLRARVIGIEGLKAEFVDQRQYSMSAGPNPLTAHLDNGVAEFRAEVVVERAPTDAIAGLKHHDVDAPAAQLTRGHQAGEAGTDHNDVSLEVHDSPFTYSVYVEYTTYVKSLRQSYAENTRSVLIETGRRLFVERGYAAVSAEELVQSAGLSRGALYHHFDGKRGLFEAVFEEQETSATKRIERAMNDVTDPWQQALCGMDMFLEICGEHEYREIVLLQGPIALGWPRWRELDKQHFAGLLTAATRNLIDAGLIRGQRADLVAAAIYGMLTELSLTIAAGPHRAKAREDASELLRNMLRGITTHDA